VVHCPYCHGWERRDLPLAVLAVGEWGVHQAVQMRRFSDDVVLCTNGTVELTAEQRGLLDARGLALQERAVTRLEGSGTSLEQVVFDDGTRLARTALFCHVPTRQASDLPERLGCKLLDDGSVEVNDLGQTSVAGVYAAGDMARRPTMPVPGAQVIIAAAEGATAAGMIDQELLYAADGDARPA
jgi:thioredoxin reductase